jgi:hypothetical protein
MHVSHGESSSVRRIGAYTGEQKRLITAHDEKQIVE